MAYKIKHLNAEQQADIAARATATPSAPVIDDSLRAAWEADLVAHMALHDATTDKDVKKVHADAIKTLEAALNAP